MSNHDDLRHEYFEELCALASSGQISEADFIELQEHLRGCAACRSAYADFIDLLHDKLPLAHPDVIGAAKLPFLSETSSYRERFLARARMEGVAISLEAPPRSIRGRFSSWFSRKIGGLALAPIAIAALLSTVGLLGYALYETNLQYIRLASESSELSKQVSPPAPPPSLPSREGASAPAPVSTPDRNNDDELARVRAENEAAETRSKTLDEKLTQLSAELDASKRQSEQTNVSRGELEKKLKDAEQLANAVRQDLQEIRQARSKDALTIAAQDLEIRKISEQLAEQTDLLAQEGKLLEASREVRDLMGSRSFHIVDIGDVDSKGKSQRAFGRIFYTEGKSALLMYAFDLNGNAVRQNASFQVWGKRGSTSSSVHSLGLFQIDDQKLNRWVLRFEDPQILAQIDSVFVTVEPAGGSSKPTGRQFLNAYLDTTSR
jgi:hypothetical protein